MWYSDADGDGLGHDGVTVFACEQPADFVAEAGDPEPNCITNDTDDCGVCAGSNADMDCVGVCFGEAFVDGCERCVGGTSPIPVDEADFDGDDIPDVCDGCNNRSARTIIQWENTALYNAEGGLLHLPAHPLRERRLRHRLRRHGALRGRERDRGHPVRGRR